MKQALTLSMILLFWSCLHLKKPKVVEQDRQEFYVGDKINDEGKDIDFQTTKGYTPPTIEVREGNYFIRVGKNDIIKHLQLLASEGESVISAEYKKGIEISLEYLISSGDVIFDQMWSAVEEQPFNQKDTEEQKVHRVVKYVLREQICALMESGRFHLIEDGKEQKLYYFKRVDSKYGGNVKGVFSKSNQMVWICPPFVIE